MLERVFHLTQNQTTVRRELLAGLATFMTRGYVVVVKPRILSDVRAVTVRKFFSSQDAVSPSNRKRV